MLSIKCPSSPDDPDYHNHARCLDHQHAARIILVVAWLFPIVPATAFKLPQITSARPSCWNEALHQTKPKKHLVDGIECVEVTIDIPLVGPITILEATVESQEDLVNMSLEDSGTQLNAGDPYGTVLWPAASAVAAYMLKNNLVRDSSVLELGSGTGLVSIAASLGGASHVLATDYESVPLRLLEYASRHFNSVPMAIRILDLCDDSTPLPLADLVVAADTMYQPKTGKAMARRTVEALRQGSRVLVGTSPGRAGRQAFVEELESLGVKGKFVSVDGWTCCGERHYLICGKGSTSVSKEPRPLAIDILDLDPTMCL
jgi:predicted nicotinamide N-methyase